MWNIPHATKWEWSIGHVHLSESNVFRSAVATTLAHRARMRQTDIHTRKKNIFKSMPKPKLTFHFSIDSDRVQYIRTCLDAVASCGRLALRTYFFSTAGASAAAAAADICFSLSAPEIWIFQECSCSFRSISFGKRLRAIFYCFITFIKWDRWTEGVWLMTTLLCFACMPVCSLALHPNAFDGGNNGM